MRLRPRSRRPNWRESLGIEITDLDDLGQLDLTIDGADEFDPELNLIKGAGAALLAEKIVATASDRMVVITDRSKQVERLGENHPVPIEVVRYGHKNNGASNRRRAGQDRKYASRSGDCAAAGR